MLSSVIGPRGPGSAGEEAALRWASLALTHAGLNPEEDRFVTAGSVFRPHLVAALGMLASFALYPFLRWPAAVLAAAVVVSEILELTLRPNPLQWVLPKAPSGNVFAVVEPSGHPEQDLVLIGHLDTQRTPKIFSSPGWFLAYRAYSTVTFTVFVLTALAYALGAAFGWPWVWPASTVTAVLALLLVALCLEAERSPFTAGANDNATGAGLVLALAEELAARPLKRTRVWCLCTGSEEALHEGARTFFRRHLPQMVRPRALVFEMLGCAGPAWLLREGIVLPLYSDRSLRALAARVAGENPQLGAYPTRLTGGVTEMSDALLAGVPAITLIGVTREGRAPYWHLPTDTWDKVDPEVLGRAQRFALELVRAVDAGEG